MIVDHHKFSCLGDPNSQVSELIAEKNISYINKIVSDADVSIILAQEKNYNINLE